jgi:phosphoribosylformimino-5-aminoimidazole carboxamide ribotide isomerase
VLAATSVPVIASGGVAGLEDLSALRTLGVAGVIVGKAIYEGRFTVEEAVHACTR